MAERSRIWSWIRRSVKELVLVAIGAAATALLAFFKDELHARVDHFFTQGNLGGKYVLRTFELMPKGKWEPYDSDVELKHFGTRVIGERSTSKAYKWELSGFFREPILSLSYENVDRSTVGTGTYTLQRDGPFALWGHWIGIDCDPDTNKRVLAQCPVLLYRTDKAVLAETPKYKEFMSRQCIPITLDTGPCPLKPSTR